MEILSSMYSCRNLAQTSRSTPKRTMDQQGFLCSAHSPRCEIAWTPIRQNAIPSLINLLKYTDLS